MKIYISFKPTDNPYGGGNQFLRSLKKTFSSLNCLTNSAPEADIILYNGHHEIEQTVRLKSKFPDKIFVHRMDGLQKLYNNPSDKRQDLAITFNKLATATVFQSNWAKEEFAKVDFAPSESTVIYNASDPDIFNTKYTKKPSPKTRLLCTSWSENINKGFNFYKILDDSLDFNKFDFTFIGNKPAQFEYKNILCLPPIDTLGISSRLRQADIFVSATVNDCCSNSIIEALSCGVPVLAKNSGGNPELIKNGGLTFNDLNDFVSHLDEMSENLKLFTDNVKIKNIIDIAKDYTNYFKCLY